MCSLERNGYIFILTLTGLDEHRFNPELIDSVKSTLNQLKSQISPSSSYALITTAQGKYFSNGFDFAWTKASKERIQFVFSQFGSLLSEFLSLPMPTIAAVTGHAAAVGFIFALAHDYIVMRRDRGFLYFSELDLGMVIPARAMSLIRAKIGAPKHRRLAVLRGGKITASMAVEMGLVDSAHDGAKETLEAAVKLGTGLVERKWNGHVYAENRKMLLGNVWDWKPVELVDGEKKVASRL
ncbi:Enoyl-CoA hydratase/isomerase [Dillenia turbinata]|uniref:Delta(3)-Delta(2)-enoyl-CoA isomerase n=1 Tax=Dillenia turbinata TaxID=194707 RepID=A0AAN8VDT1_9MAGN